MYLIFDCVLMHIYTGSGSHAEGKDIVIIMHPPIIDII